MNSKFELSEKVYYLNTAKGSFEEGVVRGIQALLDPDGKECVLYQLGERIVLAECEVFRSVDELKSYYRGILGC